MGGVYLISRAALPDWSVNQGELLRIPAENVNFQIPVMNMQQQKPTQPVHGMKVLQQESTSWPNMTHSSYFFPAWDNQGGMRQTLANILELWQWPRWIWNNDSSVSGISVFNPSVSNVRLKWCKLRPNPPPPPCESILTLFHTLKHLWKAGGVHLHCPYCNNTTAA